MKQSLVLLVFFTFCSFSETRAEPKDWGVYQIYWRPNQFERELDAQLTLLGGSPAHVMFYRDLNPLRTFPRKAAEIAYGRDLVPIISLELWDWHQHRERGALEAIVAGERDDFFTQWAAEAVLFERPVMLRFGFEMNGDWFPWAQKPELYVQAWRRVHRLFDDSGVTNVQWVWSPNILYGGQTAEDLDAYYPGPEVVDVVACDGFNFGDEHDKWHVWESYEEVFEETISALTAYRKPMYLAEVGCAQGPRKAEWLRDFLDTVCSDQRVSAFIYFNYNKTREREPDWRIDSDVDSLSVFRSWATQGRSDQP